MLHGNGVAPRRLEIALTESVLMAADPAQAVAMLGRIRATGVRLALDDFGTGYSSRAFLSRCPVDALKVDRSSPRPSSTWRTTCA